jgi:hypothetical protein
MAEVLPGLLTHIVLACACEVAVLGCCVLYGQLLV